MTLLHTDDGTVQVNLRGDAGMAQADDLSRGLLPVVASKPSHVVLDLSELTFISSLAIGQLVILRRGLASHGGRVTIAGANERVLKALRHARLESLFEFAGEAPQTSNP